MRRHRAERGAAPAGARVRSSRTRAAPGLRPGSLGTPARSLADGGRLGRPSRVRRRDHPLRGLAPGEPKGTPRAEPKARPGAGVRTPRWSADRRAPFAKGRPRRKAWRLKDAPLGAPSPRLLRGGEWKAPPSGERRRPARGRKEYGRRSVGYLKFESEALRRSHTLSVVPAKAGTHTPQPIERPRRMGSGPRYARPGRQRKS